MKQKNPFCKETICPPVFSATDRFSPGTPEFFTFEADFFLVASLMGLGDERLVAGGCFSHGVGRQASSVNRAAAAASAVQYHYLVDCDRPQELYRPQDKDQLAIKLRLNARASSAESVPADRLTQLTVTDDWHAPD